MKQKRANRYRFYPTPEQATVLARAFGCARFVYDWALRLRADAYFQQRERLGYHEASAALTTLKQHPETAWLNEVSGAPLQQALRHLDKALPHLLRRSGAVSCLPQATWTDKQRNWLDHRLVEDNQQLGDIVGAIDRQVGRVGVAEVAEGAKGDPPGPGLMGPPLRQEVVRPHRTIRKRAIRKGATHSLPL